MAKLKKIRALIIIVCAAILMSLSGCSSVSYGYRDISELQVIQTIGFDPAPDGGETVSVSSGEGETDQEPVRMSIDGASISDALERLQDFSVWEDIFYSDAGYILFGEKTAEDVMPYLDFIGRSARIRFETPLFIVRGDTASRVVTEGGGDKSDITQLMTSVVRDIQRRNSCRIFSCGETAQRLLRDGATLVCAIKPEQDLASDGDFFNVLFDGYAILKDGKLEGYLSADTAQGAVLLLGQPSYTQHLLSNGVVIQLSEGSTKLKAVWGDDGSITGVDVDVDVAAVVLEDCGLVSLSDPEMRAKLEDELAAKVTGWIEEVLHTSKELEADFLSLGTRIELDSPRKWRNMSKSWEETLPELSFKVKCNASLTQSFFLDDPLKTDGGQSNG